ncbi:isopenicillin N synthase family dioxygenase [Streptomyces sp. NPDC005529]|uniref:isopenicillin N synthase family dioxygenase n=1 Tax=unclassified Streptomyces TaxID=2593676 RepID=UPI0033B2DDCD
METTAPLTGRLPVVDFATFTEGPEQGRRQTITEIAQACKHYGFFYIRNHGIAERTIDAAFTASAEFFARPLHEKNEVALTRSATKSGWFGSGFQVLDPEKATSGDHKEGYRLGLLPNDHPLVLSNGPLTVVNQWPGKPVGFQEAMVAYGDAVKQLARKLLGALALGLGLEERHFDQYFSYRSGVLLPLHYPPQRRHIEAGRIGAGAHTDFGALTILAQDNRGGLQVQSSTGSWIDAPPLQGTVVVNLGDLMARWTNGIFASAVHRVVNTSGLERYSLACFYEPDPEAVVECLPSCVNPRRPAAYPPLTAAEYIQRRIDQSYTGPDPEKG